MSIPLIGTEPVSSVDPKAVDEYKKQQSKLQKATQEFEAVFIGMMLKQMRKSMTGGDGIFGNSPESKTYQEMMDDTLATNLSQTGSFGLAKVMYRSLERTLPPNPEAPPKTPRP